MLHFMTLSQPVKRFLVIAAFLAMIFGPAYAQHVLTQNRAEARDTQFNELDAQIEALQVAWHNTKDEAERSKLHMEAIGLRAALCAQGDMTNCPKEQRLAAHYAQMEQEIARLQERWHDPKNRGDRRRLHQRADRLRAILCKDGNANHCPEQMVAGLQKQWMETQDAEEKMKIHHQANQLRAAMCSDGKKEFCPKMVAKNVDIDRLAYAVAVAETSNCTAGTGRSKNNCHGIFGVTNGQYGPRTFATTDQSFEEFKKLWLTKYGDRFPTLQDAQRYSGGPGDSWLNRVTVAYQRGPQ